MQSKAPTPAAYLASLSPERRAHLERVRKVVRANLDKGFEEHMAYGMLGYSVPLSKYPMGYHCDPTKPLCFAGLASQKNYMALYMMCLYGSKEQEAVFRQAWAKTGKKLDMGKCCIRFKSADDLAFDVIGDAIKRVTAAKYIEIYEGLLGPERLEKARKAAAKLRPEVLGGGTMAKRTGAISKRSGANSAKPQAKKRSTSVSKLKAKPKAARA